MEFNKNVFNLRCLTFGSVARMPAICLCLLLSGKASQAQFLNDIKSIVDQIGELEAYKELASKGYKIFEDGIQSYKTIKGAEYSLHATYFASLQTVSPEVTAFLEQSGALSMIQNTANDLQKLSVGVTSSSILSPDEKIHIGAVASSLLSEGEKDADMIGMIVKNGVTSMSDGDRIYRLKPVIQAIKEQHRTAENLIDQIELLIARRGAAIEDIEAIQSFY